MATPFDSAVFDVGVFDIEAPRPSTSRPPRFTFEGVRNSVGGEITHAQQLAATFETIVSRLES
ncbi:MAG: hypothetical protein M3P27_02930 [Acidobacteriota bacterium]|nr:hypothetical protein [Acidobacteriota bacterium]